MEISTAKKKTAVPDQNTNQILEDILKQVEEQHPFNKSNFVSMEKMAFLWLIGKDAEQLQEMYHLLQAEIRRIVDDERTMCIISSVAGEIKEENIFQIFYDVIECAADDYLEVDLLQLKVCPVFLPGCLLKEDEAKRIAFSCIRLQREMRKHNLSMEWDPYLIIESRNVDNSRNQVNLLTALMMTIMNYGLSIYQECCYPCCLISDLSEKGQRISLEQSAKIVVMLTVFRNTNCKDETPLDTIIRPIKKTDRDYFFTARAISICEPVKSLMLNRMLAVHEMFFYGPYPQKEVFDNWEHNFFHGVKWKGALDKVPHDEHNRVMTSAILSMIPVSDPAQYEKNLRAFCDKYYFEPFRTGMESIVKEWWLSFWEEYFLKKHGSLSSLDNLEENRQVLIDCVPLMAVNQAGRGQMFSADMRSNCELWMIGELSMEQKQMVKKAMEADSPYMARFRKKKEKLKDMLSQLQYEMKNQVKRMGQTELLLNTGGDAVASPMEEAKRWLQDYCLSAGQKVLAEYQRYQKLFCEYYQGETDSPENMLKELLDIYSEVVEETIESRESYMSTKLSILAGTDMKQVINRLGENWRYPVRLTGGTGEDTNQRLYMMGSRGNTLYRKIMDQPHYQVAYKENSLDDRLEIVRISNRFSSNEIFTEGTGA